jgi:hypothetical protein
MRKRKLHEAKETQKNCYAVLVLYYVEKCFCPIVIIYSMLFGLDFFSLKEIDRYFFFLVLFSEE